MVPYAIGLFTYSLLFNCRIIYFILPFVVTLVVAGDTPVAFTKATTRWFDKARCLAEFSCKTIHINQGSFACSDVS